MVYKLFSDWKHSIEFHEISFRSMNFHMNKFVKKTTKKPFHQIRKWIELFSCRSHRRLIILLLSSAIIAKPLKSMIIFQWFSSVKRTNKQQLVNWTFGHLRVHFRKGHSFTVIRTTIKFIVKISQWWNLNITSHVPHFYWLHISHAWCAPIFSWIVFRCILSCSCVEQRTSDYLTASDSWQ